MYVPSDFFRTTPKWQETFPSDRPMIFPRMAQFHILSKEVDPLIDYSDSLESPDADYLFSSKVSFQFLVLLGAARSFADFIRGLPKFLLLEFLEFEILLYRCKFDNTEIRFTIQLGYVWTCTGIRI